MDSGRGWRLEGKSPISCCSLLGNDCYNKGTAGRPLMLPGWEQSTAV
jgi:hypothetical protein